MTTPEAVLRGKFPMIRSTSPERTHGVGGRLAASLYPGLLVLLHGDLGAGKTCLARAVGEALGLPGVKSPTFALEHIYRPPCVAFSLVHADLYRLEDASDFSAQLEEHLEDGAAVLVEWGERWRDPPVRDRWDVRISCGADADERRIELAAYGERALEALAAAYAGLLDDIAQEVGGGAC